MIQTKEKERKQIENEKRRENEQNKTKILEESYKNLEKVIFFILKRILSFK